MADATQLPIDNMSSGRVGVSLQINLAPTDYPVAKHTLPHQLRRLASQVDEIVLTLETQPGRGRFAADWEAQVGSISGLIADVRRTCVKARCVEVDYSEEAVSQVASAYF